MTDVQTSIVKDQIPKLLMCYQHGRMTLAETAYVISGYYVNGILPQEATDKALRKLFRVKAPRA